MADMLDKRERPHGEMLCTSRGHYVHHIISLSRQVALEILTETQRKASSRTYMTSISVISSQVNDVGRRCELSSSEDIVGVL